MTFKLVEDMMLWGETGQVPDYATIYKSYPELDRFGHRNMFIDKWEIRDYAKEIGIPIWLEKAKQRDKVIAKYGFAIPCLEAIEEIRKHQPLIEVGAGSGYWTWLLNNAGINCLPTDPKTSFEHCLTHAAYGDVFLSITGADAVTQFPDRNVLMIWPSYHEKWAEEVLKAMQPGRKLLSVTEGHGGCCATDKFFNLLEICFIELNDIHLPQWDGIHDCLYIHKKKEP